MKVVNQQHIGEIQFDAYKAIKLPSHSYLKSGGGIVIPTEKMQLGSLVDAIITGGKEVDTTDKQYHAAKKIAAEIMQQYSIINMCRKQYGIIGTLTDGYMQLNIKGLLDLLAMNIAVLDIKITGESFRNYESLITYFGYSNQLWLYSRLANVNKAGLIVYSTKENKAKFIEINITEPEPEFWRNALYANGVAVINN